MKHITKRIAAVLCSTALLGTLAAGATLPFTSAPFPFTEALPPERVMTVAPVKSRTAILPRHVKNGRFAME